MLSTDIMSLAVVTLSTRARPGLAIILPLVFQVPILKVLFFRCTVPVPMLEALSSAAASLGGPRGWDASAKPAGLQLVPWACQGALEGGGFRVDGRR